MSNISFMRRVNIETAINLAYKKLYNCKTKDIDKHLDELLKAKKFYARQQNKKNIKAEGEGNKVSQS